jgi:hypothetical protein
VRTFHTTKSVNEIGYGLPMPVDFKQPSSRARSNPIATIAARKAAVTSGLSPPGQPYHRLLLRATADHKGNCGLPGAVPVSWLDLREGQIVASAVQPDGGTSTSRRTTGSRTSR